MGPRNTRLSLQRAKDMISLCVGTMVSAAPLAVETIQYGEEMATTYQHGMHVYIVDWICLGFTFTCL
jgi:hypothetical protein